MKFYLHKIHKQLINFSLIGGFGVLSNWILFSYLKEIYQLSTFFCSLIFYIFVLTVIFPMQKFITFKKRKSPINYEFNKFFINHTAYIFFDFCLSFLFVDQLHFIPIVGKFFSLALMTPLSFLSQKYWVFKG